MDGNINLPSSLLSFRVHGFLPALSDSVDNEAKRRKPQRNSGQRRATKSNREVPPQPTRCETGVGKRGVKRAGFHLEWRAY
jgi:hypothetical protein